MLPLIVAPLFLTGIVSSLSARNGITRVTTGFLRFKAEELEKYAGQQWAVLANNGLTNQPEFVRFSQDALASFAKGLTRSETELILAVDDQGQVAMQTGPIELLPQESAALMSMAASGASGWQTLSLGGVKRVAQVFAFAPFGWTVLVTERRDTFYRVVDEIAMQSGLILATAAMASLILLFLLSGYMTRPLQMLLAAMNRITSTGDLSGRVEILYQDETGRLGHTFNLMTGELEKAYNRIKGYALQAAVSQRREKRIRTIFQKYVPEEVLHQFFRSPESMLVGENRVLAVLFSDIRGFTTIAENLRPDQMVEALNHYFGLMVDIIMNRQGIVDKYIGDAIMAFFGAPVRHDDDADRAVRSAFEMIGALQEFNAAQSRRGLPPFQIGVGITFGEVTIGNIGSERKMDYTVIGDMVNLASRIEGLTRIYREPILISESVQANLKADLPCRLVDLVAVRGKQKGVRIYAPRQTLSEAERQAWPLYHQALELYYRRDFEAAAARLRESARLLPDDPGILRFLARCRTFLEAPPPPGWDGVEIMQEK